MDLLDRTLQQITEGEQDIYDELIDSELEGLRRINSGEQGNTLFDMMGLTSAIA